MGTSGDDMRDLANEVSGVRGHDGAPPNATALVVDAHEAVGLLVDDRTIDLVERNRDGRQASPAGLLGRDAHVCELGAGVGAPGNHQRRRATTAEEQRILNDEPRGGIRGVSELVRRGDVAGGVHTRVRRAQPVVDLDALPSGSNARRVEVQPFDVRRPPCRNEHGIRDDFVALVVFRPCRANAVVVAADTLERDARLDAHAVGLQAAPHDRGPVGIFPRQHTGRGVDHRHGAPEQRKRLRELAPDRPTAHHEQPSRPLRQVEYGFVREITRLCQSWNVRRGWASTAGDHRPPESKPATVHADMPRIVKGGAAEKDVNAGSRQSRGGIVRCEVGAACAHARHHGAEVHCSRGGHSERAAPSHLTGGPRRSEQRLGWHAAHVEAIATEQRALDERNARAQTCSANGGDEPRRAAANHHEVIIVAGRHGPRGGPYVVEQTPVVLVEWREFHEKVRIIITSFARLQVVRRTKLPSLRA